MLNFHKGTLSQLLNIKYFSVSEIIKITEKEIHIRLIRDLNYISICSGCRGLHLKGFHSSHEIVIEDLPISGRRVFLYLEKRVYRCSHCGGILVEVLDWLLIRCTRRYGEQVYRLSAITTNQEAGWYLGIDDETVYRIDRRMLEEMARKKLVPFPEAVHLSVDEVSYRKYHRYLTNVVDTDRRLVIWNDKGRKAEVLNRYYNGIGKAACENIESVALDGARTYISSTQQYAVNALIVYDRFHIIQQLNKTVDTVRKQELDKAHQRGDQELIQLTNCKQRFILLKNKSNYTEKQKESLERLCAINQPIYKAMLLKEDFLGLYECSNFEKAKEYLVNWIEKAKISGIEVFKILAEKFTEKMTYIINWFHKKISSAISEGINNKIKRLKRMAYGYKDIEYFKLKIHQHCGLLNPKIAK